MKNKIHMTVVIPTCYGGQGLVQTVRSIYASARSLKVTCLIRADSRPLSSAVKKELSELGAKLTENKVPGSQYHKVNQMAVGVTSDYLITTQDDVTFDPNFFAELKKTVMDNPQANLILPRISPAQSLTLFQKILDIGVSLAYRVGIAWNNGDNYLLANGRCMVFKNEKKFLRPVPESVVNGDAYRYFANKFGGGTVVHAPRAIVYNKNPRNLKEQLNQNHRFRYSRIELEKVLKRDLAAYYALPQPILFRSVMHELVRRPILTVLYLILSLYLRSIPYGQKQVARTSWEVAESTKS